MGGGGGEQAARECSGGSLDRVRSPLENAVGVGKKGAQAMGGRSDMEIPCQRANRGSPEWGWLSGWSLGAGAWGRTGA